MQLMDGRRRTKDAKIQLYIIIYYILGLPDFCSWYSKEIGAPQAMAKAVKIKLIDVSSAFKTIFKIPLNILVDDFRKLKQSIWDIFWELVSLKGQERTFRLIISALATENVGSKSLNASI
jgi:hypothetical protein